MVINNKEVVMAKDFEDLFWADCWGKGFGLVEDFPVEVQILMVARHLKRLDLHEPVIGLVLATHPWERRDILKWLKCAPWTLNQMIAAGNELRVASLSERKKWYEHARSYFPEKAAIKVGQLLGVLESAGATCLDTESV